MAALKIGAFASQAAVSIKTLRFYDRAGVFRPAYVDARSGYRYYELGQLAALRELRLLRALGCSVSDLRSWVQACDDPDSRTAILHGLREFIGCRLRSDRQRLQRLDHWIEELTSANASFGRDALRERTIPSIAAYTLRDRVRVAEPAVYRMFEAAERTVARQHARAARPPFLLLHHERYRDTYADVEVCVPVHTASMTAVGGRTVEGMRRAACLGFSGSYAGAAAAYQTIRRWMRNSGVRTNGPLRETYLRFGADQRGYKLPRHFIASTSAAYRTELQVPFAEDN
ncbi:MAG: MerR family transcriptional regulator [Sinobacteraceae bacterium]|nr:MerR family transcriptional regulator [Nevskiaceae bacterium]